MPSVRENSGLRFESVANLARTVGTGYYPLEDIPQLPTSKLRIDDLISERERGKDLKM